VRIREICGEKKAWVQVKDRHKVNSQTTPKKKLANQTLVSLANAALKNRIQLSAKRNGA
jgi:hypothetical protein